MRKRFNISFLTRVAILFLCISTITFAQTSIRFAVIGDFGKAGSHEQDVANLVKSWNPDFIITVGDNNYENGSASTIDENIGQYYHDFIFPYTGSYGQGADTNKFFPIPGNHDWHATNLQPYIDYFELPNNERYYDFTTGNVHFFMLDSDSDEPDGNTSGSTQATWFQDKISNSNEPWKIVCTHHPPYSSGQHGSYTFMQNWNFPEWGATTVISGHDHTYERIELDGFTYFVNGLGGKSLYNWGNTVNGSQVKYNNDYGAMLVEAYSDSINFKFYNVNSDLIDSHTIYSNPTNVEPSNIISSYSLEQNYPNPFNPSTKIKFTISDLQFTSLKVYDVLGNEVKTLVNQEKPAGEYEVAFNAANLPSGIYFYELRAGSFIQTKKMTLIK